MFAFLAVEEPEVKPEIHLKLLIFPKLYVFTY